MRKQLWLILLAAGLAAAVMMKMKQRRSHADHRARSDESGSFEGGAGVRSAPTAKNQGFEGAAVIRGADDVAAEGVTGGAGVRSERS